VFARYGVWAVFFGRFVALLRIFAGPLAGALRMRYPRFLTANAVGGLIWACGTTAAVYRLGASVDQWFKDASWIGLVLGIGAGVAVSTVFRRRLADAVVRHAATLESRQATPTAVRSQEMPPDGPRRELVP
jgi:membrane protein DedA with SNARE-associated domain